MPPQSIRIVRLGWRAWKLRIACALDAGVGVVTRPSFPRGPMTRSARASSDCGTPPLEPTTRTPTRPSVPALRRAARMSTAGPTWRQPRASASMPSLTSGSTASSAVESPTTSGGRGSPLWRNGAPRSMTEHGSCAA